MPKIIKTETATTTIHYTTLISIRVPSVSKLLIVLRENNVNDVKYKIEGSCDEDFTNPEELKEETVIAKGASASTETLTDPWLYIRVRHKTASGSNHGSTTCEIAGS